MKLIFVSLALAILSTGVMAQSGLTTRNMTCAQAKDIVASQGVAVLRTGTTTYDRYVRDSRFCGVQEMARPAWVRTADVAQCLIGAICRSIEIDNGR